MKISPALFVVGFALTFGSALPGWADASPTVTLLEAGSGTKSLLRLQPKLGDKSSMSMTMVMNATASFGDQKMPPQVVPPITMVMDTEIAEIKDDKITMNFKYTTVEVGTAEGVDTGTVDAMKAMVSDLIGLNGQTRMTSRGFVLDGALATIEGASPAVQEIAANVEKSLMQLSAPLPAEPVGVGAKWQVDSQIENGGITIDQVAVYTLTSLEGNRALMDVNMTQSAPEQMMKTPQGDAKLVSMNSTGLGTTVLDLASLLPEKGDIDANVVMKMSIDMNGQAIVMDLTTQMSATLSSAARQ